MPRTNRGAEETAALGAAAHPGSGALTHPPSKPLRRAAPPPAQQRAPGPEVEAPIQEALGEAAESTAGERPSVQPGIYLHVPFCASICHYCDFNRVLDDDADLKARYVEALHAEIAQVAAGGQAWPAFGSVFVGGGTPTTLPAGELAGVLAHLRDALPLAADAEVTVEANPEDVTTAGMAELAAAGVNRVSMGAQSFAAHVLTFLGRRHGPERPLEAVEAVRAAGIARVSLDLIYGAPGETAEDWERSLRSVLDAGLVHVSAYALTVEANTPYAALVRRDPALAPDEDVQAERMAVADRLLGAAGLERYEISNWARPGAECRHNLVYWRGGDWVALGAGAHGHRQGRRWWNLRAPAAYVARLREGASPVAGEEVLSPEDRRTERLMLGLRLAEGIPRPAVAPLDERVVAELAGQGLLTDDGERLALTKRGRAFTDGVVLQLAGLPE